MKAFLIAAIASGAISAVAPASAAVLFSDDFSAEATAHGTQLNFSGFGNFAVSDGTVDLIAPVNPYGITCETGGCVDLDGSTRNAGTLTSTTTFDFLANVQYSFTARVSANQRNLSDEFLTMGVTGFGSVTNLIAGGSGYADYSISFLSGTAFSGQIFIGAEGGDNFGPVLSSLSLSGAIPATVPLPASAFLLTGALAGIGALRRRRKAA